MVRRSVEHLQEKWKSGFPSENATTQKEHFLKKSMRSRRRGRKSAMALSGLSDHR
jgi:hypothetical protein